MDPCDCASTPAVVDEQILLGDEAVARGAIDAGISGGLRLPRHTVDRDLPDHPDPGQGLGPASARPVVHQREGGAGRRRGHVICRPARHRLDEARGPERRGRSVHERGRVRHAWRAGGGGGRRPGDAQLAERAGLALLRRLCDGALPGASRPAAVLRLHARGVRAVGAAARAGAAAPGHAAGAQPCSGASRTTPCAQHRQLGAGPGALHAHPRQRAAGLRQSGGQAGRAERLE